MPKYELPDPLTLLNGEKVVDAKTWREKRRPEILELFRQHVYGRAPLERPKGMTFEVFEQSGEALGGKAERKQVRVNFTGKKDGPGMDVLMYLPNGSKRPAPIFVLLNFRGNHAINADPAIRIKPRWVQTKSQGANAGIAEKNKKESAAFLAENKKKEGVTTLPSGLQYEVIRAGTGKKPSAADRVEVHYRGTLIDGTEFDSSYKRKQTASFQVGGVIPGWTEALKLMPVGSKWKLFIPSGLGYGARGSPPKIGPNAALIFEVELISIK